MGSIADAAASAAGGIAEAATAAAAMAPRIDLLLGFADVFVGGVLSTLSAWVIGGLSLWLGLEPGRKLTLPLGLLL